MKEEYSAKDIIALSMALGAGKSFKKCINSISNFHSRSSLTIDFLFRSNIIYFNKSNSGLLTYSFFFVQPISHDTLDRDHACCYR